MRRFGFERGRTGGTGPSEESGDPAGTGGGHGPERAGRPRRWPRVLAVTAAVLVVGAGGLMKFSESPTFCRSCHIMEPYYEAWATSGHNKVACVECHYPPEDTGDHLWRKFQAVSQVAKFVTRTYSSKPYAVVENKACLRSGCHSEKLLEGKIVFAGGVKFDHLPHLRERRRGRQLRCVSCHSQIVVGRHVEVTLESCFLCHWRVARSPMFSDGQASGPAVLQSAGAELL